MKGGREGVRREGGREGGRERAREEGGMDRGRDGWLGMDGGRGVIT